MSKIRSRGIADVLHHLDIMETWGSGRKTVLEFLSHRGKGSTAEIAEHIGLTTRATRDWLRRLQADDEVTAYRPSPHRGPIDGPN